MLFVLGGNGTHAGANAIHEEVFVLYSSFLHTVCIFNIKIMITLIWFCVTVQCRKRRLKVAVVGVPKTIDNDILLMDKTFGFDTAVEEAQRAINSAYIEVQNHTSLFPLLTLTLSSFRI